MFKVPLLRGVSIFFLGGGGVGILRKKSVHTPFLSPYIKKLIYKTFFNELFLAISCKDRRSHNQKEWG